MIFERGPTALIERVAAFLRQETASGSMIVPDPAFAAMQIHGLLQSDLELRGLLLSQMPSKADLARRVDCAVEMFLASCACRR